jgi:putative membrane protein
MPSSALPADPEPGDIPPSRPHHAWIVTSAIEGFKTVIWALIPLLFSVRDRGASAMAVVTILFALGVVLWRALQWRNIWYAAQAGEITVTAGLVERSRKSVRAERIHAVDTVETPLGRSLGVSELRISTAGAAEALTIPAISRADAERLRAWIASVTAAPGDALEQRAEDGTAPSSQSRLIRRLSRREVLITGLTSGRIAPALALAAFGIRIVTDLLPERYLDRIPFDPDRLTPGTIAGLIAIAALLAWGLSILGSVMTLWDFTLQRTPESVIVTSGLIDRKQNTVGIQRIQGITVVEGILRQPFGLASITMENAARARSNEEFNDARTLFPLIRIGDVEALLADVLPELAWSEPEIAWRRLPERALRRYLMPVLLDFALVLVLAIAVLAVLPRVEWWYGLSLLPVLPLWLGHAYLQYRDAAWATDDDGRLFLRRRDLDRRTTMTARRRVQIRSLASSVFQRRAGLGSLTVTIAASGLRDRVTLHHVDATEGAELLDWLAPVPEHTRAEARTWNTPSAATSLSPAKHVER